MKTVRSFINKIDLLNEFTGKLFSWFSFFIVLVVCYDVMMRYLFSSSSVAFQELEWHMFAIVFLGGAAYTLKYDEHVRIDVFYSKLSSNGKAIMNIAGTVLFLIPFCVIVIYTSESFVSNSFLVRESSPDSGGLPARYILKSFIILSFFLILLQGISEALKNFITLSGKEQT